jgi:hypothetical protein
MRDTLEEVVAISVLSNPVGSLYVSHANVLSHGYILHQAIAHIYGLARPNSVVAQDLLKDQRIRLESAVGNFPVLGLLQAVLMRRPNTYVLNSHTFREVMIRRGV